jgi:MFS family permease
MPDHNSLRLPPRAVVTSSLAVAGTLPGDALLYAVLPILWADLGLELWMVGVLLSANRFVRLLTNPFAGWLVERVGMSAPFKLAVLGSAGITAAYALAGGFAALLVARISWGLCWSFLRLGAFLAALEASDARTRGATLGFSSGLVSVGTLVAMLFGGFLTDSIGFHATVLWFAALAAMSGVAFLGEQAWPLQPQELRVDAEAAASQAEALLAADRARRLSVYLLSFVNSAAGAGIVVSTFGLHLVQRYGEEIPLFGIALGVASLNGLMLAIRFGAALVLAPLGGRISDRVGRVPSLALAGGVASICLFALSLRTSVLVTLGLAVALFLAATVLRVTLDATAGDCAPPEVRPRVMAAYANAMDLGSALGPFLAYPLAEALGLPLVYRGAAFCMLLAGCVALAPLRRLRT